MRLIVTIIITACFLTLSIKLAQEVAYKMTDLRKHLQNPERGF